MSRVLVTGGVGTIGSAVVRRLLRESAYEVRVSDQREAPAWMREACDVRTGDLRSAREAAAAVDGQHGYSIGGDVHDIANFHAESKGHIALLMFMLKS